MPEHWHQLAGLLAIGFTDPPWPYMLKITLEIGAGGSSWSKEPGNADSAISLASEASRDQKLSSSALVQLECFHCCWYYWPSAILTPVLNSNTTARRNLMPLPLSSPPSDSITGSDSIVSTLSPPRASGLVGRRCLALKISVILSPTKFYTVAFSKQK